MLVPISLGWKKMTGNEMITGILCVRGHMVTHVCLEDRAHEFLEDYL
jgi:hypothetical protein